MNNSNSLNCFDFNKENIASSINTPPDSLQQSFNCKKNSFANISYSQMCLIHSDKKAKYSAISNNEFYCSKCAVKLAAQGVLLTELQQNHEGVIEEQIKQFCEKSSLLTDEYPFVKQKILDSLNYLSEYYLFQKRKITNVFDSIIQNLIEQKQGLIEEMTRYHMESQIQLNDIILKGDELFKQQKLMLQDIEENYKSILQNISLDKFLEIFSNYKNVQVEIQQIIRKGKDFDVQVIKPHLNLTKTPIIYNINKDLAQLDKSDKIQEFSIKIPSTFKKDKLESSSKESIRYD